MKPKILQIKELTAGYGGRPVLESVNLEAIAGEKLVLIGPNGCGKSTLLRALTAEIDTSKGSIQFSGKEITHRRTDQIIRNGIAYLRQNRNVFPGLTVAENLDLATMGNGGNREQIIQSFPNMQGRESIRAGLLSGGERQSLAVAMVLLRKVDLLLLDEPVAGLSPKNATMILQGISELQQQMGFAMIVVEHRLRLVHPFVERVVVMVRGSIAEDTRDCSLLEDEKQLSQFYQL